MPVAPEVRLDHAEYELDGRPMRHVWLVDVDQACAPHSDVAVRWRHRAPHEVHLLVPLHRERLYALARKRAVGFVVLPHARDVHIRPHLAREVLPCLLLEKLAPAPLRVPAPALRRPNGVGASRAAVAVVAAAHHTRSSHLRALLVGAARHHRSLCAVPCSHHRAPAQIRAHHAQFMQPPALNSTGPNLNNNEPLSVYRLCLSNLKQPLSCNRATLALI